MDNVTTNINKRRTARILTVACGLLFSIFSIAYLSFFQQNVVEALHYSLAQGKTVYAPWISAVLITVVLLILRWAINALIGLKGPIKTLSYFPSCLLLGVLTDVGHGVYHGEGISSVWSWLLPLLLFLYVGIGWILSRITRVWTNINVEIVVNSNLLILLLLCFMTVSIGNSNVHFHHELQMEEALRKQEYEEARKIGKRSMDPSRNLTALRAYSMSREGTMGEYLFSYPQLYGAAGLLIGHSDHEALRMNADSLYVYLGAKPFLGESAMKFFQRICQEESGNYTTLDYYLSALLLEKKLDQFATSFEELYRVKDSIPRYYRQALFLHQKMNPVMGNEIVDEIMQSQWEAYEKMKKELSGTVGEGNLMRRKYGDTYWWYYQYR